MKYITNKQFNKLMDNIKELDLWLEENDEN